MKTTKELAEELEDVANRLLKHDWTDEAAATLAAAAVLGSILSGIEASLDNIHDCM